MARGTFEDVYPLSPLQGGLLFHALYAPEAGDYVVQNHWTLRGDVDAAALRGAWQRALDRHAALRAAFTWEKREQPLQVILRAVPLPWVEEDWRGLEPAVQEERFSALLREDRRRGFDLGRAPLLRLFLIRLGEDRHRLAWSFHHLLLDGWSVQLLFREVLAGYAALRGGAEPAVEPVRPFRDYIAWLRQRDPERTEAYWRQALQGFRRPTPLPVGDVLRAGAGGGRVRLSRTLPAEVSAELQALARRCQVTLNTLFQGAWALLLAERSGERDVLFGAVVSGRPDTLPGVDTMIGLFINTLPVRAQVEPDLPVAAWLRQLQARQAEVRELEHTPLVELRRWSEVPAATPLFETLLAFESFPTLAQAGGNGAPSIPGVEIVGAGGSDPTNYPLALSVYPRAEIALELEAQHPALSREVVEQRLADLETLLRRMAAEPQEPLAGLLTHLRQARRTAWALAGEASGLDLNQTARPFPRDATIPGLFDEQAALAPDAVALVCGDRSWTYGEVSRRAGRLAARLRQAGVGPEVAVGLSAERSAELVVAILGILGAGGFYVPLDPAYPRERLAFMLADAGVRLVLVQERLADQLPEGAGIRLVLEEVLAETLEDGAGPPLEPAGDPENLAYVMYTSGSTGRPKGVAVTHRNVIRLVRGSDFAHLGPAETFLLSAPIAFDASTLELWGPLLNGGRLAVLPPGPPSLEELAKAVERHGVTALWITTALFHQLAEGLLERWAGLRQLLTGGEVMQPQAVQRFTAALPHVRFVHAYGPTEGTTFSTCHVVAGPLEPGAAVPIGRPIANARVHLLDERLDPVPPGGEGELYIGGEGLARGYFGRPDLTAERFLPDAGGPPGERLYRSGDRVRVLPAGVLDFLGRTDHQVKLRGFRIEPAEIEIALGGHPEVRQAAVIVEDLPGDRRLTACVGVSGAVTERDLRSFLSERLPEPMVPARFILLPELPLSPVGKIDRHALRRVVEAEPERHRPALAAVFATPAEEMVAGIWEEVLGVAPAGPDADFFELGGHSLLAIRAVSRIRLAFGVELPLRDLFEAPTVAGLARAVEAARQSASSSSLSSLALLPPVTPQPRQESYPASFAQERLWFVDRLAPGGAAYNVPMALRLGGPLDLAALGAALDGVVRRHEALRTRFEEGADGPVQVVDPALPVPLPWIDLSALGPAEREREALRLAGAEAGRPFDLARGPLLRCQVLRLAAQDHALLLTLHHIVADGWSVAILARDLAGLYEEARDGVSRLPELPVQYADYAVWQRRWLAGPVLAAELAFWRQRLQGAPTVLELPCDRPRPPVQSFNGASRPVEIAPDLWRRLALLGRREGATPYMVLLAALQALLGRLCETPDLLLGSPAAGRSQVESEGLIGFFVNMLVLRGRLEDDPPFRQLLAQAREEVLEAHAHQLLPFERLVEELAPRRDPGRHPLFQVSFQCLSAPLPAASLPGLEVRPLAVPGGTAKFDLDLTLTVQPEGGARGQLEYCADLFESTTASRLLAQWSSLLAAAVEQPEARMADLPLLTPAERHQVLVEWSDAPAPYPSLSTLPELFAQQAALRPTALAVVSAGVAGTGAGERSLTYAGLARRAGRLARDLRRAGVGPDVPVAIVTERSVETAVGLLAILMAGGAYLPLDPRQPEERSAWMLEEAGVGIVLVQDTLEASFPAGLREGRRTVPFGAAAADDDEPEDGVPAAGLSPRNLAYILYTSGSTGRPKGVAVEHRSVARLVKGSSFARLGPDEVVLQLVPLAFDVSTLEIWGALLNGGRLVFAPPRTPSLAELAGWIRDSGVNTLWLTAGLFHQMIEAHLDSLTGVRQVLSGGDVLSPPHVRRLRAEMGAGNLLVNGYGPTENTTFTTCHVMTSLPEEASTLGPVPIGRPVANTWVRILDGNFSPVPLGVEGELCTGGDGLARGYFGRPGLTAERFVPDRWSAEPGERLYRTGDRARWLPSGAIEFLGRRDHQVKIRGFRIELGEVEAVLAAAPGVAEAVVLAREDRPGDRRLVAYVVPREGEAAAAEALLEAGRRQLPEYMVPSHVVVLPELPLNANGKVDRRALPAPELEETAALEPPRGVMEELVAGIWAEVLGLEQVGRRQDFFGLGGHSLLATRVVSRVRGAFGVELPLRELFERPTVEALARRIEEIQAGELAGTAPPPALAPVDRTGRLPLSFAQERLWFLDRLIPESAVYNIPQALRLRGVLDLALLEAVLQALPARHESLRTTFHQDEETGQPFQLVSPAVPRPLPVVDLSGLPEPEPEARRQAAAEALRPFDLQRGPVVRWLLLRLAPDEHAIVFTMHHIVSDGWSMGVLTSEVGALYQGLAAGHSAPGTLLAPLPVQYGDFAVWQRAWLQGEALESQLGYWRERLAGVPVLQLPTDRPRSPQAAGRGGARQLHLPAALAAGAGALARRSGATPFMVLLAAWQTLLYRFTGETDLAVGSPIANRTRLEVEGLIGFFVNTLVLRASLAGDPLFPELVGRVRQATLGAYAHQDLPFERLVEALAPERDLATTPLFQVMFALQNAPARELELPGLKLAPFPLESATSAFELTLSLADYGQGLVGGLEYSADLFDATTVDRLAGSFAALLEELVARPEQAVSEVSFLTGPQRHQLLLEWGLALPEGAGGNLSEMGPEMDPEMGLHELFERQAARAPDAVALVWRGREGLETLSYAELDARAECLAGRLVELGTGPERPVAVLAGSSPELIAAMLGIWKAGGVYLPLDPAYPPERLALLLEDAEAGVVLVQEGREDRLPAGSTVSCRVVSLAEDRPPVSLHRPHGRRPAVPESLAWIIYTSGSTGRPKGVGVGHRAAARHLRTAVEVWGLGPGDRMLQAGSPSFDASLEEMVTALIAGAALVLRGEEMWEPSRFSALAAETGVTVADLPAALWHPWVQEAHGAAPPDGFRLRLAVSGGEAMSPEVARLWFASPLAPAALQNSYGPTEAVISVTLAPVLPPAPGDLSVPIGRPLPGRSAYVLDRQGLPVPPGVRGELSLGGILARGYLGRPELTAERFVPDPFAAEAGARLYRSGDLVRLLPDGRLDFAGRTDHQVKLRGFRIELGEVEAALESHPGVRAAVVVLRDGLPGGAGLAAYVVPEEAGAEVPVSGLRAFLEERLPAYMVPAAFAFLPALPLTPGGKVDRQALPAPGQGEPEVLESPRGMVEEVVAGIWAEVLGLERVGRREGFFDLGGHSLLATRVVSRLRGAFGVELALRELFEAPTVAGLASRVERALRSGVTVAVPALVRVPRTGDLPLSFAQQRLWFLDQLAPGSALYNIPVALRLEGPLETPALAAALAEVVRRHEALRTVFVAREGRPAQVVLPAGELELPRVDLAALPAPVRESELAALAEREASRPFDLARGPLLRVTLARLGEAEHALLVTLHHIVGDGWSLEVLVRETAVLYQALAAGRPSLPADLPADLPAQLPELPVQYADFAVWQRGWLAGEVLEAELAYWRGRLSGAPALLELPLDRPRPAAQSFRGGEVPLGWSPELSVALGALARREGGTPFMLLLAGVQALLGRWSGQLDVSVGTPIAGRNRLETEGLIGLFVNTLVLRAELSGDPSFRGLLEQVRERALEAYLHQDLPFEKLVEELSPERSLSYSPLFQVMLAWQAAAVGPLEIGGLRLRPLEARTAALAKFDLLFGFHEDAGGQSGALSYNADLFEPTTARRLAGWLARLLASAAAAPDSRLSELELLSPAERQQLLVEWNDSGEPGGPGEPGDPPGGFCLQDGFEGWAGRDPERTAVVCGEERLSYGELEARANRLAWHLRSLGVGPERRVAVCLERSAEMVVVLLAVLKAGGAYVPLDPSYPSERLGFMLEDSGAVALVAPRPLKERLPASAVPVVAPGAGRRRSARRPPAWAAPSNLAYAIYTSGSTGQPKAVGLEHRGAAALVEWSAAAFSPADLQAVLASTSLSFDLSVFELFVPLSLGGSTVVVENALRWAEAGAPGGVTLLNTVPSVLAELLRLGALPPTVRTVNVAGEPLPAALVEQAHRLPGVERVLNLYGPSEDTTYSTGSRVEPDGRIPAIGRPILGTRAYLVDADLRPVAPGAAGELCLAGAGLARGYLDRPGLTAGRFIPDPFAQEAGGRLYRTGDLARHRPDGELEYLGRIDTQVKVRGFRIELGEVEAVLAQAPAVAQAVVLAREDRPGDRRLVAFVVGREDRPLQAQELLEHCRRRLPEHMVPSRTVELAQLPLNPNGKVDRRALALLPLSGGVGEVGGMGAGSGFLPPRDHLELSLARIWEEVLDLREVGVRDSFFELGGHSLLAVELMARVEASFGRRLPLDLLFRGPTVERLALALRDGGPAEGPRPPRPILVPLGPTAGEEPLFLVHAAGGDVLAYHALASRLAGEGRAAYGLRCLGLEPGEEPVEGVEALAASYVEAIRTVQPAGPYRLAGWSMGGLVAWEMARVLTGQGQPVAFVALIDSFSAAGEPPRADQEDEEAGLLLAFARDLGLPVDTAGPEDMEALRAAAPRHRLDLLHERARAAGYLPPSLTGEAFQRLYRTFRANVRSQERYVPGPLAAPAVLLRAVPPAAQAAADASLGWRGLADLAVHDLPGDHYSILRPPAVAELTRLLEHQMANQEEPVE